MKHKLERYLEISELEKKLEREKSKLRTEILEFAEGQKELLDTESQIKISVTTYSQTRLDSEALKAEKPDVYAVYSKISDVTKLTVRRM